MNKQVNSLTNDVDTLADGARALMAATGDVAGEKVAEARKRLTAALERGREIYGRVREQVVEGAKKRDLMAAVVTHMVDQRIAMDARKAKMEGEMMKHMMQHMQMGKESMAKCPMMNGMDEKSAGHHNEHQAEPE